METDSLKKSKETLYKKLEDIFERCGEGQLIMMPTTFSFRMILLS